MSLVQRKHNAIDLTGQRFGRLLVLSVAGHEITPCRHGRRGQLRWSCVCDCGRDATVVGLRLRNGRTRSCGCLKVDPSTRTTTHGATRRCNRLNSTPEYRSWRSMRARCEQPKHIGFHLYGGRGIRICERWTSFENFLADMGPKPGPNFSLDRIDVDGNYEPSNCRWATPVEQSNNRRPHWAIRRVAALEAQLRSLGVEPVK